MKIVPETNLVARTGDVLADELGRRRVGRELHAVEVCAEHVGGRAPEQGLGRAWGPLQQDVSPRHRGDEQQLDGASLSDDDLADLGLRALAQVAQAHVQMCDGHAGRPPLSISFLQTIVGRSAGLLYRFAPRSGPRSRAPDRGRTPRVRRFWDRPLGSKLILVLSGAFLLEMLAPWQRICAVTSGDEPRICGWRTGYEGSDFGLYAAILAAAIVVWELLRS